MNRIPMRERKPRGLLFGGFTAHFAPGQNSNVQFERYADELGPVGANSDSEFVIEGLFHHGLETFRSFGNHRIATHIRRQGWDVECIDYAIFFTNEELKKLLDDRITKDTLFVGFSMMFYTVTTERLKWFTDYIRETYPWVTLIAGGQKSWTVTCVDADYYVTGNGEFAMTALCKYMLGEEEELKIHKTLKNGGQLITAQHSYPCFPKRDANISFEERDHIMPNETINIEFSRGCIFECKYCSFPLLGMKQDTTRDEDSVYEELLENYEKWGITNYYVTDDTINDSKDKIALLARAVRRLPFKPMFHGYIRADLLIRHGEETWKDMVDMGLTAHSYGIESFNRESSKAVGKGMKPEELKTGLLKIKDYFEKHSPNYYCGTFTMMAGLPHETFETLESTKDWVNTHWRGHAVSYLPLMLSQPDDEQADAIDWKVYNNFMKYGYTYSYDEPMVVDPETKEQVRAMSKGKKNNKMREKTNWNYWVHPSGDYDFVDMIEWVKDFTKERVAAKTNPAGVWQTCFVHAETWQDPKEGYKYYKENHENLPVNGLINIIRKYKQNKLDL